MHSKNNNSIKLKDMNFLLWLMYLNHTDIKQINLKLLIRLKEYS